MPKLKLPLDHSIRPKITSMRLINAIDRYSTAYSLNTTAAVHALLTKALTAEKFLNPIDPEEKKV